jgi:FtsP/CotA-like multicopper oxidase with cupredoxin domain
MSNLFGFLVIEGTESDIDKAPGIEGATEVFMMLSEGLVDPVTLQVPPFFPIVGAVDLWYSVVNGYASFETEFIFAQGETVLFRAASAGVEPTINLFIPGMTFVIVARDGFPLSKPEEVDVVQLSDGGRVEFLARFDQPGTFTMSRQAWGTFFAPNDEACKLGFGPNATYPCISYDIEQVVANITVLGFEEAGVTAQESKSSNQLIDDIVLPPLSQKRLELTQQESVASKTVTFEMATEFPLFQVPLTGEPGPPSVGFGVNGRFATPHHSAGDVTAGTCETWTVIANPPGTEHPLHIHGAKYLVLEEDGVPVEEPFWRDTMMIKSNFTAKVCFEAVSPGEKLLVHCHAPSHMDIGMLTAYTVVAPEETPEENEDGSFAARSGLNSWVLVTSLLFGLLWL